MKLTKKQKEIIKNVNFELDGIYEEQFDTFNDYVLVCLETIKNYDGLREDAIKYFKQINNMNDVGNKLI